ncbi:MAG: TonB-dependent receptor [Paraprevotella sp.]|nr:TonB-dependent receptor [Paraprevotella sp.]
MMRRFSFVFMLLYAAGTFGLDVYTMTDSVVCDTSMSRHDMYELVVTATRTPRTIKDVPVLTRVLDHRDIALSDAVDLSDLLSREMPGVEFSYSMNQKTSMNMGGFAGQGILVLVDGERLAGETMENVDFSRLNLNNVERIEIVRGAQSALYGAGAVGGVINIITGDPKTPWTLNLNGQLGDHRAQRYGGVFGLRQGKIGNTLDVQYHMVDNYTVCMDYADDCEFRRVYGERTWNVKDKLTWCLSKDLKLTARAGYYFKEMPTDIDVYERSRDFAGWLKADWSISDVDNLEVSLAYDQYDKSDLLRLWNRDVMDYRNVQMSVRSLYNRTLRTRDVMTVGGDYVRNFLYSYQFDDGNSRVQHIGDLFVQYDCRISDCWEVIGAGRWDYFVDERSASQVTGKLGLCYKPIGRVALRAGYAGGFRAPTLKEKYSRFNMVGDIYVYGNEKLVAEKSHNVYVSSETYWQNYHLSVSATYSRVGNRISTSAPVQGGMGEYYISYMNQSRVNVMGLELLAQGRWVPAAGHSLAARVNYVFTGEWCGGDSATPYAPARPHSFNVRLDWDCHWSRFYSTTFSVSGRVLSAVDYEMMQMDYPFATHSVHNPAYTIWRLQLQNRLGQGIRLNVAVDNIFNYAPRVYYFNSPVTLGVNLMAGISVDVDKLF